MKLTIAYTMLKIRAIWPDRRSHKTNHKSCYTESRIRVIDISTPFTRAYASDYSIWRSTVKCALARDGRLDAFTRAVNTIRHSK